MNLYASKINKKTKPLSHEYINALKQHSWNGNIRELKNVIERSVILMAKDEITIDTLPQEIKALAIQNNQQTSSSKKQLSAFDLASAEKIHIQKVLNYTNGNKTKTAELLNIALTTLYRKLSEYGLD